MKLIVANTKMYLDTTEKVLKYQNDMSDYKNDFIVAPQSIYLDSFIKKGFTVASQSVSSENDGPYTGEISPRSLADLKTEYVIIGHAEVRKRYSDENKYIRDKISKSLENNLKVILCVGEDSLEKSNALQVLDMQLDGIKPCDNLMVSYEPIWAIGGSEILDEDYIKKMVTHIRSKGFKKVLYGGSITGTNIVRLNKLDDVDGFLIGSRSVEPDVLKEMIEVVR